MATELSIIVSTRWHYRSRTRYPITARFMTGDAVRAVGLGYTCRDAINDLFTAGPVHEACCELERTAVREGFAYWLDQYGPSPIDFSPEVRAALIPVIEMAYKAGWQLHEPLQGEAQASDNSQ